jgi:hypothetical protein
MYACQNQTSEREMGSREGFGLNITAALDVYDDAIHEAHRCKTSMNTMFLRHMS